ncbi:serine/threonine-protein kinase [Nocardia arthritidis]|uniref:non-specific serine/threonine protein kinase n=1 Tax=Nocardia arthritidis TaxID=228602 RepID=A0A6G9YN79_9NOCA|nr:serine/threonine-protein kinase [Nocardia arthritidis]QIS14749.1 protein kinase [Nocardia arthritidis]
METRIGTRFGPYELRSLLGKGGMGEVYEAYDTVKDRIVAVKLLSPDLAADPRFQERFRRESQAAARLAEPHVIPIHDWGVIEGTLYIDMRLVRGEDLKSVLREQGPLPAARAVHIVEQIAAALDAAHAEGLVHRDVKPANILVTATDFAYLADFGIARSASDPSVTGTGVAIGSYSYIAPERFDAGPVTGTADVYSLTCVLYESLTGAQPFPSDGMSMLIRAHLSQPPPRPSRRNPRVPTALDEVIARGMAKAPAGRYPTAGELAAAARSAIDTPPAAPTVRTRPAVPAPPTAKFLDLGAAHRAGSVSHPEPARPQRISGPQPMPPRPGLDRTPQPSRPVPRPGQPGYGQPGRQRPNQPVRNDPTPPGPARPSATEMSWPAIRVEPVRAEPRAAQGNRPGQAGDPNRSAAQSNRSEPPGNSAVAQPNSHAAQQNAAQQNQSGQRPNSAAAQANRSEPFGDGAAPPNQTAAPSNSTTREATGPQPVRPKRRVLKTLIGLIVIAALVAAGVVGWLRLRPAQTPTPPAEPTHVVQLPANAQPCAKLYPQPGRFASSAVGTTVTSCPFAEEVRKAFNATGVTTGSVTVTAHSPAKDQDYQMICTMGGDLVTCSGGENAIVYLY